MTTERKTYDTPAPDVEEVCNDDQATEEEKLEAVCAAAGYPITLQKETPEVTHYMQPLPLRDIEADRLHPKKKFRPIAAGEVPAGLAWALAAVLMIGGVAGSFYLKTGFGIAAASYLCVTLTYSTFFKHTVLLDVMLIAAGFVLRAVAGAEAIPVPSSPWFLTCTAFGALFIAFSKRLAEIRALGDAAGAHRPEDLHCGRR